LGIICRRSRWLPVGQRRRPLQFSDSKVSCELAEKAQIILRKETDVGNIE
jgi:hypothetical protein